MGSVGWELRLGDISSRASKTRSTTASRRSRRPRNVRSRSMGESGRWNSKPVVKLPPTRELELLVVGELGGDGGVLAPWLSVWPAAPKDTARRAAVTMKDWMSMKVSASRIRIVALALQLGLFARDYGSIAQQNGIAMFSLNRVFSKSEKGSVARDYGSGDSIAK